MTTKTQRFFYDMVTCSSYAHSTHGLNIRTDMLADTLRKAVPTEQRNDRFIDIYAFTLTYTVALTFAWQDDVPDEFKALETWWDKARKSDKPEDVFTAYQYMVDHVPNQIWGDLNSTIAAGLQQWKPAHEKMQDNQTEAEKADPKSSSSASSTSPIG